LNANDDPALLFGEFDAPLRRPLVAVLPFDAADGDAALRLLGSELADLLREGLSAMPDLRTILIRSECLERAPDYALDLICRQLRIGQLVTGRCHHTPVGNALYIEVSETREGKVLWARYLRGEPRELLAPESPQLAALRDELAHALCTLAHTRIYC
jgi:TolB-like protein